MKKFSNILLASDFDATLTNDRGEIPENVITAIEYFISEGGLFTVCTGRTYQGFHAYSDNLINAPVLLANGIMAYDYKNKATVFCDGIGRESCLLINNIIERFPDCAIELYSADFRSFVINADAASRRHFENLRMQAIPVEKPEQVVFQLVKIMISAEKDCKAMQDYFDSTEMGDVKYIPSDGDFVELINKVSDKGNGLLKLSKTLSVPYENVFAAGDGQNDVDMLNAAYMGFAPSNAHADAKKAASITVCSSNDGAIAQAIDEIAAVLLKREKNSVFG